MLISFSLTPSFIVQDINLVLYIVGKLRRGIMSTRKRSGKYRSESASSSEGNRSRSRSRGRDDVDEEEGIRLHVADLG